MIYLSAFFRDLIAGLISPKSRVNQAMPSDALISQAVADANNRADQLIITLAKQYPELDRAGVFAAVIAQHALYLAAAANGPEWARRIADDGVTAFEYDQAENHA